MITIRQVLAKIPVLSMLLKHRIVILKVAFLLVIVSLVVSNIPFSTRNRFETSVDDDDVNTPRTEFGLILDTSGCKVPKLDPFDKSVKDLIVIRKPYVCHGDTVFLAHGPNGSVVLDHHILRTAYGMFPEELSCSYKAIYRAIENKRENYIVYGDSKPLKFGTPLGEEFLEIQCKLDSRKKKYTQYLPLAVLKPEIEKRASEAKVEGNAGPPLNVVLIGIDSVSKLNFLRHFKKTHDFLVRNLSAFDMKGYTKVGDNTFPNLVPLLTGHFVEHYWNESVKDTMSFDDLDFIWKAYANKGYRTFYTEDNPFTGTFNYLKRGFLNPPTDYYFRTLGIAIQQSELRKKGGGYCLNNQLETEILYGYLRDFVREMGHRPYFAFTMVSTLTHDQLNDAGYCDQPTYDVLTQMRDAGVMNRSLVVVFSDHGIRFGKIRERYIGKIEERMPFMYLLLPGWFLERNENVSRNLRTNRNRLMTLFDVHATMRHLLMDPSTPIPDEFKPPNGLSLLGEIPESRTCEEAAILPHWCPCQVYQRASTNDSSVLEAAMRIVDSINMQFEEEEFRACARLEVDEISDARVGGANDKVLKFVRHVNDVLDRHVVYGEKASDAPIYYLITLRTRPGGAIFEGTVRRDPIKKKDRNLNVMGISRINAYGNQSWCINSQVLKKFCFCK